MHLVIVLLLNKIKKKNIKHSFLIKNFCVEIRRHKPFERLIEFPIERKIRNTKFASRIIGTDQYTRNLLDKPTCDICLSLLK